MKYVSILQLLPCELKNQVIIKRKARDLNNIVE